MNKDVIYIDVDDDITTIVGKIKASKEKIVALVPPSRVGVLQSAVNMRLLNRAAEQADKRLVLISHNQSLLALAGIAGIPVARTLQSKPEMVEAPVMKMDGDEIIDGDSLPIGEHADSVKMANSTDSAVDAAIASSDSKSVTKRRTTEILKDKKSKVPNFSSFRKKIVLIGGGVILLLAFLVWAIWFAPSATVLITAKTTSVTVDKNIQLAIGGETNVATGAVQAVSQEAKQEVSVDFTATGKKDVGDKATGKVKFSTNTISSLGTIPAGTELSSSSGAIYLTDSAITLTTGNNQNATTTLTAANPGTKYNGASGSLSGAPNGVTASLVGSTGGGTDKTITVVSQDDIAKASQSLGNKKADDLNAKIKSSFKPSVVVIDESFTESRSDPSSSVAVGSEADGPVTLKSTITASMIGIDKPQLESFLKQSIEKEISGKKNQKIYDDGADNIKLVQFTSNENQKTIRLTANGKIGPEIDQAQVKQQSAGKKYGEIQASLESIDGVSDVDTKFWPFWVRTVPKDVNRITVEFKLQDAS